MFKAVAVENRRKKYPVWKRISLWYKDYSSEHNRSLKNSETYNAGNEISHDVNSRIAAGNPEIFARNVMR
jgi:hypothetical protein